MNVFNDYAFYYDLLYQDKDYNLESSYIDKLIKKYNNLDSKKILELGCGTAKHALLLSEKNYEIDGVDFSSKMIEQAKNRVGDNKKLNFFCQDIRDLNLNNKYDTVLSLFHVFSYLTSNKDLDKVFSRINQHLNNNGILIFDCWYGPAVLTNIPEVRIKKFENDNFAITRIAQPEIDFNNNIVAVNYELFVIDKTNNQVKQFKETHKMRYLFKPEIEYFLSNNGFELIGNEEWLTGKIPGKDSWGTCFIAKKI